MNDWHVSLSPTARLRDLAAELRRDGRDVIDLSAGELNYPTPGHIVAAAVAAACDPALHHYGSPAGDAAARGAVRDWHAAAWPGDLTSDQIIITNGAKHAIFNSLLALLDVGDEVIVPSPYWVTFPNAIRLAGGVPVIAPHIPAAPMGTAELFERVRTADTKALILVSPHNPTGSIYTAAQLSEIADWALRHSLWVLSDDTYWGLAFADAPRLYELAPELASSIISIGSVSKSHAMTGWRAGWAIGPREIIARMAAIQSHTTSNVNRVAQAALTAALRHGDGVTREFREDLRNKRDVLLGTVQAAGLSAPPPLGGFYYFPSIAHITSDDASLCAQILAETGVNTVPGSAFGAPGHLRISYSASLTDIATGATRLAEFIAARRRPTLERQRGPRNPADPAPAPGETR